MVNFAREKATYGQSLARLRHKRDQEELNHQFWASVLAVDLLERELSGLPRDVDGPADALLGVRTTAADKLGHERGEAGRRLALARRWGRLSTLLVASSALERFLIAAMTAAVESDPLRQPGFPKRLDGLTLKKHGIDFPPADLEIMC